MSTRIKTGFPKFYINEYGAFYEGEIVDEYCISGENSYYFSNKCVIEKFFTHYVDYKPEIYFKFHVVGKKRTWSFPCEGYLGILYRKSRRKNQKKY